jgi:hypothetical protein
VIDFTLRDQPRGMAEDTVASIPRPRLPLVAAPSAAASAAPPQPPLARPRPPPPPLSEEEIVRIAPRPLTCTLALPFLVFALTSPPPPPSTPQAAMKLAEELRIRAEEEAAGHTRPQQPPTRCSRVMLRFVMRVPAPARARHVPVVTRGEQLPPLQKQRKSSSA